MSAAAGGLLASTVALLGAAPFDRPLALLLRHAAREALPEGEAGNSVPITDSGRQSAGDLGAALGGRLRCLHSSPVLRCVQTAEALAAGSGAAVTVVTDRLLGDPGVFVVDGARAWSNWEALGHEGVMMRLIAGGEALPGMARPAEAARRLVQHLLEVAGGQVGVHVFVTHDSVLAATAAHLLGEPLAPVDWPLFLEGAVFWREGETVHGRYRRLRSAQPWPLCVDGGASVGVEGDSVEAR